jgi:oxygen-dependent protoporphyrinogen oxidase
MAEVVVIGGGIAGLTAAYKVHQAGHKVRVLEAQAFPGGNVRTIARDGFRMEIGPHSFMGSSEYVWRLTGELALEDMAEPARSSSRNRYIYRNGRLHPLPMGAWSFLKTPLLSWRAKVRVAMEPFIPGGAVEGETAWEFFCRRFGEEAATYIMSPFVSGIYAGDLKRLGARAAFAKFWQFEKDSGSMIRGAMRYMRQKRRRLEREGIAPRRGLFSFRGGLGLITDRLARTLDGRVQTGSRVESIRCSGGRILIKADGQQCCGDAAILAVPPQSAAAILAEAIPGIVDTLNRIPMAPVALVHWTSALPPGRFPSGFGFLMPRLYDLKVLGTIFASQLFSSRAPADKALFSSFFGGTQNPDAAELADDELEDLVGREHERILHLPVGRPETLQILRYRGAIPQLLPDHPERIAHVWKETGRLPGLYLAGNYLTGVGLEHAVESGFHAAERCLRFLHNGRELA